MSALVGPAGPQFTAAETGALRGVAVGQWTARTTNPKGLRRWRAAFAAAIGEFGVCRVNCIGDSITLGTYSNNAGIPVDGIADAQGYVGRLRTLFARRVSSNPAGFMPANDSRNTLSGTGTASPSIGPVINTVRTSGVTTLGGALPLPTTATISIPVPRCTTIEIAYCDSNATSVAGGIGANTGTFSYAVDGGAATTTTADNSAPVNYKRVVLTGLSDATHTLLLTGVTGTSYIVGVYYYGSHGVVVSRFGLGGATALDLTGGGPITNLSTGGQQRVSGALGPSASPIAITGAITSGSKIVTGISSTAGIVAGMPVGAGSQLALPCFVESVDSATQITLTIAATASNASRTMTVGAGVTFAADLWVVPIGHNDWQQQNNVNPTTLPIFTSQVQRIVTLAAASGACVLLVGEPKSANAPPTPETFPDSAYWAALEDIALGNEHVSCVQINGAWGSFASAKALGLLSDAGGVHPLQRGSADMAALLFDVLTAPHVETVP